MMPIFFSMVIVGLMIFLGCLTRILIGILFGVIATFTMTDNILVALHLQGMSLIEVGAVIGFVAGIISPTSMEEY